MTTSYLQGGWFDSDKSLRTEVVDGAMDAAGLLMRAGVSPETVGKLALRVRSLLTIVMRDKGPQGAFSDADRDALKERLAGQTDDTPELYGFVSDCLEHVETPNHLMAFYLHLMHINQMLQLLGHAVRTPPQPTDPEPRSSSAPKSSSTPDSAPEAEGPTQGDDEPAGEKKRRALG